MASAQQTDSPKKVITSPELVAKAKATASAFKRPAYWMLFFGWGLAACAGIINTTAFRQWKTFVSHVTGTTTNIAMKAEEMHNAQSEFMGVGTNFLLVASFILGAFYSGMLIDKNAVQLNGKAMYGLALVTESVLLFLAVCTSPTTFAMCAASAACGMQNAMCTSHFGVVVRTTHVTGTATDIGSALGRTLMLYIRNNFQSSQFNVVEQAEVETDGKRLIILVPMWTCFLVGSILGAYLESAMGIYALLVPAILTCVVGMAYIHFRQQMKVLLKDRERKLAEIAEHVQRSKELLKIVEAPAAGAAPAAAAGGEAGRTASSEDKQDAWEAVHQEMQQAAETLSELAAQEQTMHLCVPEEPKTANPFQAHAAGASSSAQVGGR